MPDGVKDARIKMVDDLIKNHALQDKSREAIIVLLGEPDSHPSIKSRFPDWQMHYYLGPSMSPDWQMHYYLGPSRSTVLFKVLYSYLVFQLDGKSKVVAMKIVTLKI
jgi:fatty acid desaturase